MAEDGGGLSLEVEKLRKAWERCRENYDHILSSWALWEYLNGYPGVERADAMRLAVKNSKLTLDFGWMQQHLVLVTLVGIGRLVDPVGNGRGEGRLSIDQLTIFLKKPEMVALLSNPVDLENFVRTRGLSKEKWISEFNKLRSRLTGTDRSISSIRPKIKEFRDNWLAHSLDNSPPSNVKVSDIKDAVVLIGYVLMLWGLVVHGANWDPKDFARLEMQHAKNFWRIFGDGLMQHQR